MKVERFVLGELDTNCWFVSDGVGGQVLIIDPADEPNVILEALTGRQVALIVLTHCHFDHLAAAGDLVAATGAPLAVH
ncbi:MBL fold metallo-hydrolase, partial [bacterium]|nr:MBL fold metallo-hydrolase [bacterium]